MSLSLVMVVRAELSSPTSLSYGRLRKAYRTFLMGRMTSAPTTAASAQTVNHSP